MHASINRQQNRTKWWVGFYLVSVFVQTTIMNNACFNNCSPFPDLLFQTKFKGQQVGLVCWCLSCIPVGWLIVAVLTTPNPPILPDAPKNLPGIPPELKQKHQALINLARICFNWFSFVLLWACSRIASVLFRIYLVQPLVDVFSSVGGLLGSSSLFNIVAHS